MLTDKTGKGTRVLVGQLVLVAHVFVWTTGWSYPLWVYQDPYYQWTSNVNGSSQWCNSETSSV